MEGNEVKLENLIAKIKKDGIEQAKAQAQQILDEAHVQAKAIIESANKESAALLARAKQEAKKLNDNTEAALRQAGRDLVLSLRQELTKIADAAFKAKLDGQLDTAFLKELIIKLVASWPQKQGTSFEVLLSKQDAQKLQGLQACLLQQEAAKTIEIKVSKNISHGFLIGLKGQDVYYDFSDEAILEALKVFLTPAAAKTLESDNG